MVVAVTQLVVGEVIVAVVVEMVLDEMNASSVDVLDTGLESALLVVMVAVIDSLLAPGSVVALEGAAVVITSEVEIAMLIAIWVTGMMGAVMVTETV